MGTTATRLRVGARSWLPRIRTTTGMANGAVWLGVFLTLGLSGVSASETALSGPTSSTDHRGWLVAGIILVGVQGLLLAALLVERRRRLEREPKDAERRTEVWHISRLALVGQLSASIAHEINQPLGAILSNADAADLMLAAAEPDLNEIRLILADIRKDGLRASEVVRQIETLARKRPLEFQDITLQNLCKDVLHLVAPTARHRGVTILTHFDPQQLPVRGDPVLLRQALLNLLLNAMEALVDVPASQAVIEVGASAPRPGEFEITVRDHGNGLPQPQAGRMFDAFFTTKTHGLGLGLPIVRSIIESHGGRVVAENHPDGGAVCRFTIPAVDVSGMANHPAEEPV